MNKPIYILILVIYSENGVRCQRNIYLSNYLSNVKLYHNKHYPYLNVFNYKKTLNQPKNKKDHLWIQRMLTDIPFDKIEEKKPKQKKFTKKTD